MDWPRILNHPGIEIAHHAGTIIVIPWRVGYDHRHHWVVIHHE